MKSFIILLVAHICFLQGYTNGAVDQNHLAKLRAVGANKDGVPASPQNVAANMESDGTLTVTWDPPSAGNQKITAYTVYLTCSDGVLESFSTDGVALSLNIAEVQPDENCAVFVTAINRGSGKPGGGEGPKSDTIIVSTGSAPTTTAATTTSADNNEDQCPAFGCYEIGDCCITYWNEAALFCEGREMLIFGIPFYWNDLIQEVTTSGITCNLLVDLYLDVATLQFVWYDGSVEPRDSSKWDVGQPQELMCVYLDVTTLKLVTVGCLDMSSQSLCPTCVLPGE